MAFLCVSQQGEFKNTISGVPAGDLHSSPLHFLAICFFHILAKEGRTISATAQLSTCFFGVCLFYCVFGRFSARGAKKTHGKPF
jgi:hypothetical protein